MNFKILKELTSKRNQRSWQPAARPALQPIVYSLQSPPLEAQLARCQKRTPELSPQETMPLAVNELPPLVQELFGCWSDDVGQDGWKRIRSDDGDDRFKSSVFLKEDGGREVILKHVLELPVSISSLVAACRPEALFNPQQLGYCRGERPLAAGRSC